MCRERAADGVCGVRPAKREAGARGYGDFGAFGEENARRLLVIERCEGRPEKFGEIDFDPEAVERIDGPARVLDSVFGSAPAASLRITPIVLGDELLFASRFNEPRIGQGLDREALPVAGMAPAIAHEQRTRRGVDAVAHGHRHVGLLVEQVGDEGDGTVRDKLANEDHAASACPVRRGARDIETEVHLFEAVVVGNGDAFHADAVEVECDQRDIAAGRIAGGVEIEFKAGWEPRRKDRGVDLILRHDELAPFGGKEGAGHCV
jgi:hypothetical protein